MSPDAITRALIIVDMQEGFLNNRNRWIIPNIQRAIREGDYALIIETVFHAAPGSLWDTQTHWTFPLSSTISEIKESLPPSTPLVTKTTKSAFKGNLDLVRMLRDASIEEVHITGVDANDCVFATAQESFDLGFPTYVLADCVESSGGAELRDAALKNLDWLGMLKTAEH